MRQAREQYDLVVVGAGIIGTMVALLARRRHPGWRIALMDRSLVGHGATLYSAYLDVPLGATPGRRALTERSRVLYQQLRAELPGLPLRDLPAVFLAAEERVRKVQELLVGEGTSAPRPVDAAQALALAPPGFHPPEGTAVLGNVRAMRCLDSTLVPALVRAFCSQPDSVCLEGVEVVRVTSEGGASQRLTTHDGRELLARRTALCLGPWLGSTRAALPAVPRHWRVKKIAALHVPLRPQPDAPVIYLSDDEAFLLPQPEHGRFLFSFRSEHWDCEPEVSQLRLDSQDQARARGILERYLDVTGLQLGGRVFCDAYSADAEPSVEPLAEVPGAFAVGGAAGSGFRLAPALAERAVQSLEASWAQGEGTLAGAAPAAAYRPREAPMSAEHVPFELETDAGVTDEQLASLLDEVFVKGGHTSPLVAARLFAPDRVRARGTLIAAREPSTRSLLGMLIVVSPGSAARQMARDDEAELHLLAVHPGARGRGIGRALVRAALRLASQKGWFRLVLSTQPQMAGAQALYAAAGFERRPDRDWGQGSSRYLAYTIHLVAA